MNEPTKPGKRIVSKTAFVANTGKKAALAIYGAAVLLMGIGVILVSSVETVPVTGIFLLMVCCLGLLCLGGKAVKEAKEIDAGVPLTRAGAADLSAADSLVRASSEPVTEQATVLLRATIPSPEAPPEQMLRAASESDDTDRSC